jgi:hypothetical protein
VVIHRTAQDLERNIRACHQEHDILACVGGCILKKCGGCSCAGGFGHDMLVE